MFVCSSYLGYHWRYVKCLSFYSRRNITSFEIVSTRGKGEEEKDCSPNAAIRISMYWDLLCSLAFKLFIHTYQNWGKILKIRKSCDGLFLVWIWFLDFRSCYAWSLKWKINCFFVLSQFHIYSGISLYYSCWWPTCLHCSESTLQDSEPTVSHREILPKAGKRQQAKKKKFTAR